MVRPAAARLPRVRATIAFLTETFAGLERRCAELPGARGVGAAPPWARATRFGKASTAASRSKPRGPAKR
jgi:hypothetical protein